MQDPPEDEVLLEDHSLIHERSRRNLEAAHTATGRENKYNSTAACTTMKSLFEDAPRDPWEPDLKWCGSAGTGCDVTDVTRPMVTNELCTLKYPNHPVLYWKSAELNGNSRIPVTCQCYIIDCTVIPSLGYTIHFQFLPRW